VLNYVTEHNKNIDGILKDLDEFIGKDNKLLFDKYLVEAEKEILENKKNGIEIISVLNDNYPQKLLMIKEPVLYLYYKGDVSLMDNTSVAIIGSRNVTKNDEELTVKIAKEVSSRGVTVVSGLALGIDINAHIGSYNEKGKTIVVLPAGLKNIIPSSNEKIASNILNNGGLLVSEYSLDIKPNKYTFVKRDRIQAALSDAIIVIKADEKSGTMNAVKVAQSSNKYVTQYIANKNKLISNTFCDTNIDIENIIAKAKVQEYNYIKKDIYKQVSLF
jgi:DNA processing protein